MGDIFPEKEQLIRYSNRDFIDPLSSETVLNGSNYVIDGKRLEISAAEMKCPTRHIGGANFLCMGDRFYETLPTIIWKLVHTANNGLCFQMGGSNSLSKE